METGEAKVKREADSRTHYHYEYQIVDHTHYVTLNYLEGVGKGGRNAGLLGYEALRRKSPVSDQVVSDTFKFDLPKDAKVTEVFHYNYGYVYHAHDHYI